MKPSPNNALLQSIIDKNKAQPQPPKAPDPALEQPRAPQPVEAETIEPPAKSAEELESERQVAQARAQRRDPSFQSIQDSLRATTAKPHESKGYQDPADPDMVAKMATTMVTHNTAPENINILIHGEPAADPHRALDEATGKQNTQAALAAVLADPTMRAQLKAALKD